MIKIPKRIRKIVIAFVFAMILLQLSYGYIQNDNRDSSPSHQEVGYR